MDGSRFDGFVRTLAAGQTRRRALHSVAVGVVAGLLGKGGLEEAGAACVKLGKKGCKGEKNGKCCPGTRCKGGTSKKEGRCVCKGSTKQCGNDCVSTKNDNKNCGKCNNKCKGGNTCKNGKCTSKLGCRVGQNVCEDGFAALCPGSDACVCITDVEGIAHCSDAVDATCSDCTSNADCPAGQICFDASSTNFTCGCPLDADPEGTGNGCVSATCDGISGSAAGLPARIIK